MRKMRTPVDDAVIDDIVEDFAAACSLPGLHPLVEDTARNREVLEEIVTDSDFVPEEHEASVLFAVMIQTGVGDFPHPSLG